MKKRVEQLKPGDMITLKLPCLVRVTEVGQNPRKGEHMQPDMLIEWDPMGIIQDGIGQFTLIGSKVDVEVTL